MIRAILLAITFLIIDLERSSAQITLDTIVVPAIGLGYDFKIVQISETESKYFIADNVTNTFGLYNMDFTPFLLNIPVPRPFDFLDKGYQCLYITRSLFDCDSTNIEYFYEAPTNGGCGSEVFIMRTDGTQLFYLDSAFATYCFGACLGGSDWVKPIENTSSGAKLFLLRPLCGATSNAYHIYSLCGSIPTAFSEFPPERNSFVKLYPNPSSNSITFEINPPDNTKEYQLVIVDSQGKEVKRRVIGLHDTRFELNVSEYASGNYVYSLCTKDKSYHAGKFILNK